MLFTLGYDTLGIGNMNEVEYVLRHTYDKDSFKTKPFMYPPLQNVGSEKLLEKRALLLVRALRMDEYQTLVFGGIVCGDLVQEGRVVAHIDYAVIFINVTREILATPLNSAVAHNSKHRCANTLSETSINTLIELLDNALINSI